MKELERENVRLKRLVADLSLEKQVLKDVWFVRTSRLPDCRPAPRNATIPPIVRADEDALTGAIVSLAPRYGRFGEQWRTVSALGYRPPAPQTSTAQLLQPAQCAAVQ